MSLSLHRFTRTFMEFLSRSVHSSFPKQGVTSYSSYTLQRCVTFPMRDQLLVAQPGSLPVHNSMLRGLVDDPSQSRPSPRPHMSARSFGAGSPSLSPLSGRLKS